MKADDAKSSYPVVSEVRNRMNGKHGLLNLISDADREAASSFDVKKEIERAKAMIKESNK